MKTLTNHAIALLLMIVAAVVPAQGASSFYLPATTVTPGETATMAMVLDNDQEFISFQFDIVLPEGLTMVSTGDNYATWSLTSRAGSDFQLFSNMLADGTWRLGAFSLSNARISGSTGELVKFQVTASADFAGGDIEFKNIEFVDTSNNSVLLEGSTTTIGITASDDDTQANRCYIPDFEIVAGDKATVELVLDNSAEFTGFQTDVYLPQGITMIQGTLAKTGRLGGTHTVQASNRADGSVRIIGFSAMSTAITGNSGAIVTFQVEASSDFAQGEVSVKNTRFSTPDADEQILDDETAQVTATTPVEPDEPDQPETAQFSVSSPDVEVEAGSTATIALQLDNSAAVIGFQADVCLPQGITLVEGSIAASERLGEQHTLQATDLGDNTVRIVAAAAAGDTIAGRTGTLLTLQVQAAIDALGGELQLKGITLTAADSTQVAVADTTALISVDNAVYTGATLSIEPFEIHVGATKTVEIVLDNTEEILAFQTDMYLPEGLTMVGEPEVTGRIGDFNLSYHVGKLGGHRIMPMSLSGKTIAAGSGAVIKFTVQAAADAQSGEIVLRNQHVSVDNSVDKLLQTDTALVTVNPVPLADSIALSVTDTLLYVGDTLQLAVTIIPEAAAETGVKWSSSDNLVATVSDNGMVTAIASGTVQIVATANDEGAATAVCNIEVRTLLMGDVNGDGEVTVADVTAVIMAILGDDSGIANPRAADMNGDGNYSVADTSGIISLILNQENYSPSKAPGLGALRASK